MRPSLDTSNIGVHRILRMFTREKLTARRWLVTAAAAAIAWAIADLLTVSIDSFAVPPLVASITALLTMRISLHRAGGEAAAQLLGTLVGAGLALVVDNLDVSGWMQAGTVVLGSLVVVRVLKLGDEAGLAIPVTALIVLGPGLHEATAVNRMAATIVGVGVAMLFSFMAHPDTPAGRALTRVAALSDGAAALLADIARGMEREVPKGDALSWLERARELNATIPEAREACEEAVAYSRWFPPASRAEAEAVYARFLAAEHTVVTTRVIARSLVEMVERDVSLTGQAHHALADALGTAAEAAEEHASTIEDGVEMAVREVEGPHGVPIVAGVPDSLAEKVETLRAQADDVLMGTSAASAGDTADPQAAALAASVAFSLRRIGDSLVMETGAIQSASVEVEKAPATVAVTRIARSVAAPVLVGRKVRKRSRRNLVSGAAPAKRKRPKS